MKRVLKYIPACACTILIPMLSLISPRDLPDVSGLHLAGIDKIIHFGMYFVLTCTWIYAFSPAKRTSLRMMFGLALAAGLYGAVMEVCQLLFTAGRQMDLFDAGANLAGALAAAAGSYFHNKKREAGEARKCINANLSE